MHKQQKHTMIKAFCLFLTAALLASIIGVTYASGGAGNCLDFDGTTDYVSVPHFARPDNLTISAWVKPDQTDARAIVSWANSAADNGICQFRIEDNKLEYGEYSTNWSDATSTADIPTGEWTHVAATRNAGDVILYINGVEDGTHTLSWPVDPANMNNIKIGAAHHNGGWGRFFDGQIDEVRIWDRVLTQAEINDWMYKELDYDGADPHPGAANLQAYFKLNETSTAGQAADGSGEVRHGTYSDSIADADIRTSGAFTGPRNGLDFDGTTDYVSVPHFPRPDNLTISAWVKPDQTDGHVIVSWANSAAADGVLEFRILDNKLEYGEFSTNWSAATSAADIPIGEWTHVAATRDASENVILYINGVQDGTHNLTGPVSPANMNNIKIGVSNHNTEWKRYFDGIVDEVRIWNVARTQTQIQDNVNKTLVGNEANLVAYYRMDYLTAGGNNTVAPNNFTTLYDITANGNDGTLTNFARTGATSNYIASTAFNTWIGGESTSWATAGNWSRNAAPVSADNVGIYSSGNNANLNSTVTVDNLVVATGATLNLGGSANLTVSEMDFVNGTVNRSSSAVSEETRSISGTGTQTYGLADATVDVQTLGSLSSLQVERTESAHSQENHAGGAAKIVDRYLTLTPNASPGSFSVELCFNYTDAEVPGLTESSLRLCRWTGSAWTCPSRGTNSNTTTNKVCADSITTFSDWVMGEVGPTAVTLRRFAAGLAGGVNGFVLPLALVALGAVGLLVWRRQKRRKTYVEET